MRTGFGRRDPCSNPRNTLGRGMEPNHLELGLDPDVPRRVNRVQTPKKNNVVPTSFLGGQTLKFLTKYSHLYI